MREPAKTLMFRAVRTWGLNSSTDVDDVMCIIEEDLTGPEYEDIRGFLSWCVRTGARFGRGNFDEVYASYKGATA